MLSWRLRISILLFLISTLGRSETVLVKSIPMVQVPSGYFLPFWLTPIKSKGQPSKKIKPVKVLKFEAMRYPVTIGEFKIFLKNNPDWQKEFVSHLFADEAYLSNLKATPLEEKSPMTAVSWFAATAYCKSLQMRLPTTNEWEYMAAASETKKEANKDPQFLQRILDWYGEPKAASLPKVGSIYKNVYGIWDLHGLIWEWVSDFNSAFVTGESREDSSFNKNLFCGAGAMNAGDKENYAAFMRFGFRSSLKGKSSIWNLGFRCVRSK